MRPLHHQPERSDEAGTIDVELQDGIFQFIVHRSCLIVSLIAEAGFEPATFAL